MLPARAVVACIALLGAPAFEMSAKAFPERRESENEAGLIERKVLELFLAANG